MLEEFKRTWHPRPPRGRAKRITIRPTGPTPPKPADEWADLTAVERAERWRDEWERTGHYPPGVTPRR